MDYTPTNLAFIHIAMSVFAFGLLIYHLRKFRSDALLRLVCLTVVLLHDFLFVTVVLARFVYLAIFLLCDFSLICFYCFIAYYSYFLLFQHALVNKKAVMLKYVHELYAPIITIYESNKHMIEELGSVSLINHLNIHLITHLVVCRFCRFLR